MKKGEKLTSPTVTGSEKPPRKGGRPRKLPNPGPSLQPTFAGYYERLSWISAELAAGRMTGFAADVEIRIARASLAGMRSEHDFGSLARWEAVAAKLEHERLARDAREATDREHRGGRPLFCADPFCPDQECPQHGKPNQAATPAGAPGSEADPGTGTTKH